MDDEDGTSGTFILFPLQSVVNLIGTIYSRMSRTMRETVPNRLQQIDREDAEYLVLRRRATRDQLSQCGRQCMFCSRGTCSFNEGHHNWQYAVCLCVYSAIHLRGINEKLDRGAIDNLVPCYFLFLFCSSMV